MKKVLSIILILLAFTACKGPCKVMGYTGNGSHLKR